MTEESKPSQPTPSPSGSSGVPPVTDSISPVQPTTSSPSYKVIVTTDTCPICSGLKQYLERKGLTDKVKIINASTPEGRKFADEYGIKAVPECVFVDEAGKQVRVCTKEEFEKVLTDGS